MKTIYNILNLRSVIVLLGLFAFSSCSDDFPSNIDSNHEVVLKSIKILNAGADGQTVVEGIVDENKKTVTFPRVEPETDLTAIRFEVETSQGASLDKETYTFPFDPGQSERTITIKVENNPRFREYLVTLRLKVPVFGAEFGQANIFDFTNNSLGNPIYPVFVSAQTRGSGFDGEHVLIVTRAAGGSHLLNVEDLKNNKIAPIYLNQTGVTGGTFTVNVGAIVNGHTYIANLSSNAATNPVKIYHWTDPSAAPEVIANVDLSTISGAGARHGDNMSANIDGNGNGFIFFGDNAGTKLLRLKVTNYKTITEPTVLPVPVTGAGSWTSFNRVGATSDYIFTGHDAPIVVVNEGGTVGYTLPRTAIPIRGSDARVINFNGERYLIMTTAARTGSEGTILYVYDITNGSNTVEALTLFEQGPKTALYEYSLLGPVNTSPSTQTGWSVKKDSEGKDQTLVLYTAASDAGFVIIEIPRKQAEE